MKRLELVLLVMLFSAGVSFAQEQPNMIIFISDDQSQIDMGAYGNNDVYTPHMDRLASTGMKFTKAYAATSMCTPSRSNMFTGLYPFRNGSQMNHFGVQPGVKSLPHYLKALGYRVVLAGKRHVSPRSNFPFEYISKKMSNYNPATRSDKEGDTADFIKKFFKEANNDQPLCLIVATWWPHMPWMANTAYDPATLEVPEYLVDTKGTREALAAYYQSVTEADNQLGEIIKALDQTGERDNTVFMYTSDQGVQLPGAKWTAYDQGLRVPFIVSWPKKVKAGSTSDALLSLTDLTPTLIDLAGGKQVEGLDGVSFADVFLGKKNTHRDYVYAESSLEPHYWYNYIPARTIITKEGMHYIRNYNYGARFLTHIDAMDLNKYYFDTWIEAADENKKAAFLLNRYNYRPAEELYDLRKDQWELNNLVGEQKKDLLTPEANEKLAHLRNLLDSELSRQGETDEMIRQGQLPIFYERSYEIKQGLSAHPMSFKKEYWNPETLFVTAFIEGLNQPGVLLQYFEQFSIITKNNKVGVIFAHGQAFYSEPLKENAGHLVMRLTSSGIFDLKINGKKVIGGQVEGDHTKINSGYASVGFARTGKPPDIPVYFQGKIKNMRFTMNKLNGAH